MPYGFPSGRALLLSICSEAAHFEGTFRKHLLDCGFDHPLIQEFINALNLSMQPSVDAFLEHRPEFIAVGKAATACALIPCEKEKDLHRETPNHWYEYLYNRLNPNLNEFRRNKLTILTFNYDRSLEHFFFLALKNSFRISDDDCANLLQAIPIIHLHGQLGELPYFSADGRKYEPTVTPEVIQRCASSIKIIHEDIESEPQFKRAHDALSEAKKICFLGFGYHRTNVDWLRINDLQDKKIYGSAYYLLDAERDEVQSLFNGRLDLHLSNANDDNLFTLRRMPILTD